jgi:hypothetical protein
MRRMIVLGIALIVAGVAVYGPGWGRRADLSYRWHGTPRLGLALVLAGLVVLYLSAL